MGPPGGTPSERATVAQARRFVPTQIDHRRQPCGLIWGVLWIYDLPSWLLALIFVVVFVGFSSAGVLVVGPRIRKGVAGKEGWREHVSITLEAAFVFVGLLLALVALAAYGNFTEARSVVDSEASALGTLYRDVNAYPEPDRTLLQVEIQSYISKVINHDWPEQRRGIVPNGAVLPTEIVLVLAKFQPANAGQTALSQAALAEANTWLLARRQRLDIVTRGLPVTLWVVLVVGSAVNIGLTWLLPVHNVRGHLVLAASFALVVALILFVTASLDHPFRGPFGVSPEAFQLIRADVIVPTQQVGGG